MTQKIATHQCHDFATKLIDSQLTGYMSTLVDLQDEKK